MNSAAKQLIDKRVVIKFHLLRTGSKWVRAQRGSVIELCDAIVFLSL